MGQTAAVPSTFVQSLQIGGVTTRNNAALAPMAGLSDVPFREVAWRMGAGYLVSEMLSSQPQLWDTGKSRLRRVQVAGVEPVAVQIAGTNPQLMADAARRHADHGVQVIDLNFGCPAKKVCRKAAGSALLQDIDQLAEIVHAVVSAAGVPVTAKTRTGLVPGDRLGVRAAQAAAAAGAKMIVMHGRSRACRFNGRAEHATAAELKRSLAVPVLVNGDICSLQDARRAQQRASADGVMIGRGALGQPWIFRQLAGLAPLDEAAKWQVVYDHIAAMHKFYGQVKGPKIARKHVAAYLRNLLQPDVQQRLLAAFQKIQAGTEQLCWLQRVADWSLQRSARGQMRGDANAKS